MPDQWPKTSLHKFVLKGLLTSEEAERIEKQAEEDAMTDIDEETRNEMKEIEQDYDELSEKFDWGKAEGVNRQQEDVT